MESLSILVFMLVIFSGSLFAAAFFKEKFEDTLPITLVSIVLFVFILGILDLLKISVFAVIIISFLLYFISFFKVFKDREFKQFCQNIFSSGFFVFVLICMYFFITTKGKMFDTWDEFSHWGDSVKAMSIIDDFVSNNESRSLFRTYPPGMSIFQYLLVKINYYLTNNAFCEWMCYYSYYIFATALLLSAFSKINLKRPFTVLAFILVVLLVPPTFFLGVYCSIHIDPFLSFLFASGCLELFWNKNEDVLYIAKIFAIVIMLVLTKDSGMFFALVLQTTFFLKHLLIGRGKLLKRENIMLFVISATVILLPKILWEYDCNVNGAVGSFENRIDVLDLIKLLIGKTYSYRKEVLKNFIETLIETGVVIGDTGISINYLPLMLLTFTCVLNLNQLYKRSFGNSNDFVSLSMTVAMVLYVVGVCVMYMYKFSEYEALTLASNDRYINTVFLALWLFVVLSYVRLFDYYDNKVMITLTISLMFASAPLKNVYDFSTRAIANASIALRANYQELIDKTLEYGNDSKIWYISQTGDGYDSLVYRYGVRPNYQANENPIMKSSELEGEKWLAQLKEGNYDFVAIYTINDHFYEHYSLAFIKQEEIQEKSLYKVDKDSGKLSLCK